MVDTMVALRKGKMSAEDCAAALKKSNYFGTMLVKMGKADALLGGATYSTADTVRPALQLVKTKPGAHLVSSVFIMVRGDEMLAMGDCAINIDYTDTVDKIAQRLGGFDAYGPILQGLNAPINDLSRGCNAEEVYQMSIITAALA